MKKSIAVIGQGFVGGSLTTVFSEHGFDVCVYDKLGKVSAGGRQPLPTKEMLQNAIDTKIYPFDRSVDFSIAEIENDSKIIPVSMRKS
jgi:UDP-glucose 6-dehydrogenase